MILSSWEYASIIVLAIFRYEQSERPNYAFVKQNYSTFDSSRCSSSKHLWRRKPNCRQLNILTSITGELQTWGASVVAWLPSQTCPAYKVMNYSNVLEEWLHFYSITHATYYSCILKKYCHIYLGNKLSSNDQHIDVDQE